MRNWGLNILPLLLVLASAFPTVVAANPGNCRLVVIANNAQGEIPPDEAAAIVKEAEEAAARIIEASRDNTKKVDIHQFAENLGKEVEEIFGDYSKNELLKMSIEELKFDESKADSKDGVTSLADVLNIVSDMDSKARGLQGLRRLRHLPLIGESVGNFLVKKTVDKMQTAQDALRIMAESLDRRIDEIKAADTELGKEVERNETAAENLARNILYSRTVLEKLVEERERTEDPTSKTNLDDFKRVIADRVSQLQQLRMVGKTIATVLSNKRDHGQKKILHIRNVKTVSIPITVGTTAYEAAKVTQERGQKTADAFLKFNKRKLEQIGINITEEGERLRIQELQSIADVGQIAKVLTLVSEDIEKQKAHDREYTDRVLKVIEQNDAVIAQAEEIRRQIPHHPNPEMLVGPEQFTDVEKVLETTVPPVREETPVQ